MLTWVLAALTLYLGVLFAIESVTSWVRLDKGAALAQAGDDLEASPRRSWSRPPATRIPPDPYRGHRHVATRGTERPGASRHAVNAVPSTAPRATTARHNAQERTATHCRGPLLCYKTTWNWTGWIVTSSGRSSRTPAPPTRRSGRGWACRRRR
ncbi:hypothetical protein ACFQX6_27185 [Streptosporangium lutulentum]